MDLSPYLNKQYRKYNMTGHISRVNNESKSSETTWFTPFTIDMHVWKISERAVKPKPRTKI